MTRRAGLGKAMVGEETTRLINEERPVQMINYARR